MSGPQTLTREGYAVASAPPRTRRVLEGIGFVAAWMGLGCLLPLSAEAYLLTGIPLTIAFQVVVRRGSLRELMVRGPRVGPDRPGRATRRDLAVAALLALAPLSWGLGEAAGGDPWVIGWYAAAVSGAAAAAYAVRSTSVRDIVRAAAWPTAVGVLGNVVVIGGVQVATGASIDPVALLASVLKWLAIYYPATFVIEEVAFRGALDAHLHHPGEGRGWGTAALVSALWGLWHLPVSEGMPFPYLVLSLVAWHCFVGIPLSLAWRRSGNLSGPALAHSAMDAVRNGLIGL